MSRMILKVLSDSELENVRQRTLDIFETVGVNVGHAETLRMLARRGARVDEASARAYLPRQLVNELLSTAPPVLYETGLNGKTLEVGGDNRYYISLILDPIIVDYENGRRAPVLEDVRRHTIIGQSLDRVSTMMRMQFPVVDVPEVNSCLRTMEVFLSHTTKHTASYPTSLENCREWMDAMAVIADAAGLDVVKTPLMSVAIAIRSPLAVDEANVEMMKLAMTRNYPVISTVCPMAGSTSPYSIAGTILQANAEALLAVLLVQLYKPGHPAFYAVGPSVSDMRTGYDLYYTADKMLFKTAGVQLGQSYNLPIAGEAGGTLTWRPDVQNGAESLAYMLASHATGQHIIGGLGSMYNALGMSAEQIIMQAGLVDMAEHLARGVNCDEQHLAFDSITRVGPAGNFLDDDLTIDLLRTREFFQSDHFDMDAEQQPDGPGIHEKAHAKANQLVEEYKPQTPEKVREALARHFHAKYS